MEGVRRYPAYPAEYVNSSARVRGRGKENRWICWIWWIPIKNYFFLNKNTPSMRATKIIKNQGEDILLFGQKNIARYISAQQQNNEIDND